MKKLSPLPPPPRRRDIAYACGGRAKSRRIQRVSEKKVDRFMKALWTCEQELKAMSQEYDSKPSTADSGNNEGI